MADSSSTSQEALAIQKRTAKADQASKLFGEPTIPVSKVANYMKKNIVKAPVPPGLNWEREYFVSYREDQLGLRLVNQRPPATQLAVPVCALVVPMIEADKLTLSTSPTETFSIPQAVRGSTTAGWVSINLADPGEIRVIVTSELSGCTLFMGEDKSNNTLYLAHIRPKDDDKNGKGGVPGMKNRMELPKTLKAHGRFVGATVTNLFCIGGEEKGKEGGYDSNSSANVVGFITKKEVQFLVQKVQKSTTSAPSLKSSILDKLKIKGSDDMVVDTVTLKNNNWKVS